MKSAFLALAIVLYLVPSLSNPYEKCVEECMGWGIDEMTCRWENCDPSDTVDDVQPGMGNPLQLFSYELKGTPPTINGSLISRDLADAGNINAMDEWKEACSRQLILTDSGIVQLFLVNSAETLYIGITYEHGNNGDGCGVILLFDEGDFVPPAELDGSSDFRLTNASGYGNEQGCQLNKLGGGNVLEDLHWNGSAWVGDADGEVDFKASKHFFNSSLKVHHYEFAIPLNNSKSDDSLNSDLDVSPEDAIGFYFRVIKSGSGAGVFPWIETNQDPTAPDSFPHWGKIQLSVKRNFFTFYTGHSDSTAPVVDGIIDEPVWNGAYQRDLILSNFKYHTISAKLWSIEDPNEDSIYIGLRVFDAGENSTDYCQIYFEEVGENTTDAYRDYDLDDQSENSLRISPAGPFSDRHWSISMGNWELDTEGADGQSAVATMSGSGYLDFEFKVARSAGTEDIDIPKEGVLGFLIRYHDGGLSGLDGADYYWEYTTNNHGQLLSQFQHPFRYISTGWTNMQLGGPYIEIVNPTSGSNILDTITVEVLIENDTASTVEYFFIDDTTAKVTMGDSGNGIWQAAWNVDTIPARGDTLVVRVTDNVGNLYERIVSVYVGHEPVVGINDGGGILRHHPAVMGMNIQRTGALDGGSLINIAVPMSGQVNNQAHVGMVDVKLKIFDVTGKLVKTLIDGIIPSGFHSVKFDGNSNGGKPLSSGLYVVQLRSGSFCLPAKLIFMK